MAFDVNHRAALWAPGAAASALLPLARRADLVFVGLDEAECLWHTATADDVRALLPEPTTLVVKDGDVGATEFRRAAGADHRTFVPAIPTEVVEAVGAGDAFAAGYLAALLQGADAAARLRVATSAHTSCCSPRATSSPTTSEGQVVIVTDNSAFGEIFADAPLMAILRGMGAERSLAVATTRLGPRHRPPSRCPCRRRRTSRRLRVVADAARERGLIVGAGTVVTVEQVRVAKDAGAAFTVSPGFDVEVVRASHAAGLPALPGVATRNRGPARARRGSHLAEGLPGHVARHGLVPGDARAVPTGAVRRDRRHGLVQRTRLPRRGRARRRRRLGARGRGATARVGGTVGLSQRTGAVVAANACSRAAPSTSGRIVAVAVAIAPTMQMTAT